MKDQKRPNDELQAYLNLLREKMSQLQEEYQVKTLAIFGSYLHQNENEKSDLDLLVEFHETPTLFQFIRLENYLTDLLGVEVDLVMKDSLKPSIGEQVLEGAVGELELITIHPLKEGQKKRRIERGRWTEYEQKQ